MRRSRRRPRVSTRDWQGSCSAAEALSSLELATGARRRDDVINTLRQRFLSGSHLGLLEPGDKLPSARDLARDLDGDQIAGTFQTSGERSGGVQRGDWSVARKPR